MNKFLKFSICTFLLMASPGCTVAEPAVGTKPPIAQPDTNTTTPPSNAGTLPIVPKDYVVGPGDVLEISVWKEDDLKKDVMVRPDGGITFPLVGELQAGGKTIDRINEELTKSLGEYIPDAVVHVAVLKVGQTIYVLGNVAKPGEFAMATPIDVMQALAMAGGLTPFADADDIKIIRRDAQGRVTTLLFDYDDVSDGESLEQNILLRRGDVIVVP